MFRLILLGAGASLFFSTTFILNEAMSKAGGHWLWSASLRYAFMILFILVIVSFQGGYKQVQAIGRLFLQYWKFWILTGTCGFGFFYALICYSAEYSPGWVIASTWQFTVVASLFVFMLFGRKLPKRIWFFSGLIFLGVCLINVSQIENFDIHELIIGGISVLVASFCYPFGNQLVWEAKHGDHHMVPRIHSDILNNTFNKVLLLAIGSIPFWLILIALVQPPLPSGAQTINTALVALFSGVFATSIFLYARSEAKSSTELAAVDSSQALEVVFALAGGIIFLHSAMPNVYSMIGFCFVALGLVLFLKMKEG